MSGQKIARVIVFLFAACLVLTAAAARADAATFTYETEYLAGSSGWSGYSSPMNLTVIGYNKSQGYLTALPAWWTTYYAVGDRMWKWAISYTVPDDGSEWIVTGDGVVAYFSMAGNYENSFYTLTDTREASFTRTHTTSGSFSGYSPKTATDAANQAKAAANSAATSAANAYTAANSAAANAANAYTAANNAYNLLTNSTYGLSAIKSKVDSAASYTWDSAESKSAATLAKEARDKANQALTEINNVKSMVANIQSSVGPQILKVRGANGATATRTNLFTVTIEAANVTQWRAKLGSSGIWSAWTPVSSPITLSGLRSAGAYTIYVEAQSASGATATGQMTAFRL